MILRLKMKNGSHRYKINRPRPRYGRRYTKYKSCRSIRMVYVLSKTQATFETQFMKKLINTEVKLKTC